MSLLKVYRSGELFKTLHLSEEEEYLIGRGVDCDVTIESDAGVSRQHCRIFFDGMTWQVELLSKFGSLLSLGAQVEALSLEQGQSFSIHSFDFRFENEQAVQKPEGDPEQKGLVPQNGAAPSNDAGFSERTIVGHVEGHPYLRIGLADGTEDVLRLEGNLWTAGRDASCEVVIQDRGASRRHFELSMVGDQAYIIDLNSANGTFLNGQKIVTDQPTLIKSGDVIAVLSVRIVFEMRNPSFDKELQLIPQPAFEPLGAFAPAVQMNNAPAVPDEAASELVKPSLKTIKNWQNWQLSLRGKDVRLGDHKKAVYSGIGALLLLLVLIDPVGPPKKTKGRLPANVHEAFLNLTPDKKTYIRDTFKLAKNLFLQKNYPLALKEINEIHELVPFYKDSRKIEAECKQWIEVKAQRDYLENQRRAAAELERRISAKVSQCDARMKPSTTQLQLSKCLGDVMDLNPDHPGIRRLQAIIEDREAEAQRKAAQRADYRRRVKRGDRLYYKAKKLQQSGKDYHSINAYKKYLKSGLPDPKRLKVKARRSIASLKENLSFKVESMIKRAQSYFDQSQYHEAMKVLKSSEKIDPRSREIATTRQKFKKQITRQMKTIYEDSVLEESLGNVEAAKDKWRKIQELSYPEDSYYQKAKSKLHKYGGG